MCSPERRNTMASFTNQATLTYNGGTVNSNIVTGELVQVLIRYRPDACASFSDVIPGTLSCLLDRLHAIHQKASGICG